MSAAEKLGFSTNSNSVFWTATPYAVASLTVGAIGVAILCTQTATIGMVAGIILATLGVAALYGVIGCAIAHNTPEDFRRNVGKFIATAAAAQLAQLIQIVVQVVVIELVKGLFKGKR